MNQIPLSSDTSEPTSLSAELEELSVSPDDPLSDGRWCPSIWRTLKQVHPDLGISVKAMGIMDFIIHDIFERVTTEACRIARASGTNTLTSKEIQTAVRLLFPGMLSRFAVAEGTKAVSQFFSDDSVAGADC
ncbi:hypothetical protein GEMRC1_002281 [Eukaryota sp. GEM-RC1]